MNEKINSPKYKIEQEVFIADLSKEGGYCIMGKKISEINITKEYGVEYIMYHCTTCCGEIDNNESSSLEKNVFATKEEAVEFWNQNANTYHISRVEQKIECLKTELKSSENTVNSWKEKSEKLREGIAEKEGELMVLKK